MQLDDSGAGHDGPVLAALRAGDEAAFVAFAAAHQGTMTRIARRWVKSAALADDVVQETWLTMLQQLDTYEGRSALRVWVCGILVNVARSRLRKEGRSVPMSSLGDPDEPAVDPSSFSPAGVPWEGHWWPPPEPFPDSPEAHILGAELREELETALAQLPPLQRQVMVLQDIEGFSGAEVCRILEISEVNGRVLLHRARSKMRALLQSHYERRRS